eukprot:4846797-Amphidinium_carterae.1
MLVYGCAQASPLQGGAQRWDPSTRPKPNPNSDIATAARQSHIAVPPRPTEVLRSVFRAEPTSAPKSSQTIVTRTSIGAFVLEVMHPRGQLSCCALPLFGSAWAHVICFTLVHQNGIKNKCTERRWKAVITKERKTNKPQQCVCTFAKHAA